MKALDIVVKVLKTLACLVAYVICILGASCWMLNANAIWDKQPEETDEI